MDISVFLKYIPFVIPLVLIQLGMAIYALVDLSRRTKTHGPRWAWAAGLIVTALGFPSGVIVSGIYLAWGRNVEA
jgi:hypothetical protein